MKFENEQFCLEFDKDGQPKSLLRLADNAELLNSTDPGRGFYLKGRDYLFGGDAITALDKLTLRGDMLVAAHDYARLTFKVHVQDAYMTFSLVRIEGVPAQNLETLHFEMKVVEGIGLHPLDYMTDTRNSFGATDCRRYEEGRFDEPLTRAVNWAWLWDRTPGNPLGGFILQCPANDAQHDDNLLHIWGTESSWPRPRVADDWNYDRACAWFEGWLDWSSDIRSITIEADNADELRELVDFAEAESMNQIKLFTHTWRGGFWPMQHHLDPNPEVFPGGKPEFKALCDYIAGKGMRLELHTVTMSIYDADPYWVKTPSGPDPRLANWVVGELAEPFSKGDRELRFRPAPGSSLPHVGYHAGPNAVLAFMKTEVISVGKEFMRVAEYLDTDTEVWTLKISDERGLCESDIKDHAAGERVVGYVRPYDMVFTADSNSTLLQELAEGWGNFSNEHHVTMMSLDGLEVRRDIGYGPSKFSCMLYRALDHYCTSGTSSGGPMPFHIEYWFKAVDWHKSGFITMPLALERSGRRATNPYEVHVEVARYVAEGLSVGGLIKPEPMFCLSRHMLNTHGLSGRFIEQLRLWRQVAARLTDAQRRAILEHYRDMARPELAVSGSHHMQSDVIFAPQVVDDQLCLVPQSLLGRAGIDAGWGTGQEFGPICVWQFVNVGETVRVDNRFDAQEPEFVIHVMPALTERRVAEAGIQSRAVDRDAEGYDVGAGLKRGIAVDGAVTGLALQPALEQIRNLGDHEFVEDGDGLRLSYRNRRAAPFTETRDIPCWDVQANSHRARGLGLTVTGDGSGAVLLVKLTGSGTAHYVVQVDFTGTRDIVISNSTVCWTDQRWYWPFDTKRMQHEEPIAEVGLALGHVPPETEASVVVSNLRLLAETPASLVNPTLKINHGELQVHGEVASDHYLWYAGGDTVGVYDINWNEMERLPVEKKDFIAPAAGHEITCTVVSEGKVPHPQLGVEVFTKGTPVVVEA